MAYPNRRGSGDGTPGPAGVGIASSTVSYQVSSSPTTPPTQWHSEPPVVPKGSYLWTKVAMNYTNNTSSAAYAVAYAGKDGLPGTPGAQGTPGTPGTPGESGKDGANGKDGRGITSAVVEYQASQSGATMPTGAWSSAMPTVNNGQYMWARTTINYTDSTTSAAYCVSYLGVDGTPGSPGTPGKDGVNGTNGSNGVGVASSAVNYQVSTSGTSAPTGTWSASPPALTKGQYLWTRAVVSYTDGTSTTVYSVAYHGLDGSPGQKGDPGPANSLSIGSVTSGPAAATITGAAPAQVLNLTLPPGANGVTPTFSVGTVTTLLPGSSATVTVSGTAPNYVLNFGLPSGLTGAAPVLGIGSVTTLAAGSAATATISGTGPNYVLNIGIPAGATGATGAAGINGTSYAPQSPVARTVTAATAYQHTDTTKPYKVIVNARATQTVTVAGTVADRLELRIGPTAASVAPSGTGGFSIGVWESGITGIALMIGAAVQDGGQLSADVPAGWYFQINRLSGTAATVVSCFTQSMAA